MCSNFVEMLFGCCLHSLNDFLLFVHFEVEASKCLCNCFNAGVFDTCDKFRSYRRLIVTGIVDTGDKFVTGVMKSMRDKA